MKHIILSLFFVALINYSFHLQAQNVVTKANIEISKPVSSRIENKILISPNGKLIVTGSGSIWDVTSGKLLRQINHSMGDIIVFNNENTQLATSRSYSDGNSIYYATSVFELATGEQIYRHLDSINSYSVEYGERILGTKFVDNELIIARQEGLRIITINTKSKKRTVLNLDDLDIEYTQSNNSKLSNYHLAISLWREDNPMFSMLWEKNYILFLNLKSGKIDHFYPIDLPKPFGFSVSNDHSRLLITGDSTLSVLNINNGHLVKVVKDKKQKTPAMGAENLILTGNYYDPSTYILDKKWDHSIDTISNSISSDISQDGKLIATSGESGIRLYDIKSRKETLMSGASRSSIQSAWLDKTTNRIIATSWDSLSWIIDMASGNIRLFKGNVLEVNDDLKYLACYKTPPVNGGLCIVRVYDYATLNLIASIEVEISKGSNLLSWAGNKIIFGEAVWDIIGKKLKELKSNEVVTSDGQIIITKFDSVKTVFHDLASGKIIREIPGNVKVSPDGTKIVRGSQLFAASSMKLIYDFSEHGEFGGFSDDSKILWTKTYGQNLVLKFHNSSASEHVYSMVFREQEIDQGNRIIHWTPDEIESVEFTSDSKLVVAKVLSWDNNHPIRYYTNLAFTRIDSTHSLKPNYLDKEVSGWNWDNIQWPEESFAFRFKERDIIGTLDLGGSGINLWDSKSNTKLISLGLMDGNNWVVTHPSGLFDASPGAMQSLYFVQGMEVIDFGQLKGRYYEPGLWKKIMSGEKLRNVVGMKSIELPPDILVGQVDEKGYLPIELTNKGGGIGEVAVLINGKEVIADARPKGTDSKSSRLAFKLYIGNNKALVKGTENFISVKAWNSGHWVVSRGAIVTYSIGGNENTYKPAIHIITSGVSDYTGIELDLKYAAKDAEDVSKALQLGAKKLFGTERSYVYNLTTNQPTDQFPTKANILKAFTKVSSIAHPLDVFVVYLSGHGINHGGQDGDWYYLTQDAYTASSSAYNDPEIRRTSTLSSNELVELFKKVPALKQVLMIDACASGKVVENLMTKKDIESTTLRALDRMRDRTGLHIITGCTADAVSYEASKYGQGVLTYSLLEGIRGAALREDQFVDINRLFQYAHDRVPALAEGIGGIQTPQVFSPQGGQSFDIGLLTDQEKKDIPIAKIRPVYIRSTFIDDDQLDDALQLGKKVDASLNEAASKGAVSSLIFVDVREYPEGCKLSGRYKQEGSIIKLKLRKKCEGKDETLEITGKDINDLSSQVVRLIIN